MNKSKILSNGVKLNMLNALKKRMSSDGREDAGFSLIELIIVVVIIGILVAIAIPVFGNIQENARVTALEGAASNGHSTVAAQLANDGGTIEAGPVEGLNSDGSDITVTLDSPATDIEDICVTAENTAYDTPDQKAGNGCD